MEDKAILDAASSGLADYAIVVLVILGALYYLYRKLWVRKGACDSCPQSKTGCAGCAPKFTGSDGDETGKT
ncbi:hypothetical protein [Pseudovibrio exalbescens]|uniref:Virus attachment protein p12 family protein n=1 Tax=Pseudovibrio exalbescens TaxID=197461 RepID=A0A1U7JF14_9HYPH|nr:hypothetical protein [Pseudovibrio exalbescens]OKL43346.1 hypothetical protein A3843_14060 [Pseudovibrio exalbescens]